MRQILLPVTGGIAGSPFRHLAAPLMRLLDFWQALYADNPRPLRRELRPERLVDILPNMSLVDILPDPTRSFGRRYRYRLIGTAHRQHNALDLTGRYLDEVQPPGRLELAEGAWDEIIRTVQPGFWRQYHLLALQFRTPYHFYERMFVPLFDEAGQPVLLAGVFHWIYQSDAGIIGDASEIDPEIERALYLPPPAHPR